MSHRWVSCPVITLIDGRGLVRCWLPPAPGQALCLAHLSGPSAAGQSELRAIVTALLEQIDLEAELSDFTRLPGEPH